MMDPDLKPIFRIIENIRNEFANEKLVDPDNPYVDRDHLYVPEDRHPFITAPTIIKNPDAVSYGAIGLIILSFVAMAIAGYGI